MEATRKLKHTRCESQSLANPAAILTQECEQWRRRRAGKTLRILCPTEMQDSVGMCIDSAGPHPGPGSQRTGAAWCTFRAHATARSACEDHCSTRLAARALHSPASRHSTTTVRALRRPPRAVRRMYGAWSAKHTQQLLRVLCPSSIAALSKENTQVKVSQSGTRAKPREHLLVFVWPSCKTLLATRSPRLFVHFGLRN